MKTSAFGLFPEKSLGLCPSSSNECCIFTRPGQTAELLLTDTGAHAQISFALRGVPGKLVLILAYQSVNSRNMNTTVKCTPGQVMGDNEI